jgi:hypothetical protein
MSAPIAGFLRGLNYQASTVLPDTIGHTLYMRDGPGRRDTKDELSQLHRMACYGLICELGGHDLM